jgi:hypothetical protein
MKNCWPVDTDVSECPAGDEELYRAVGPALDAMGKAKFFLGDVGAGAHMKLVVNMVRGCCVVCCDVPCCDVLRCDVM